MLKAADEIAELIVQLLRSSLEETLRAGKYAMADRALHWKPYQTEIESVVTTSGLNIPNKDSLQI